jgi:two-component system, LytTR family, sensor kinase
MVAPPRVGWLFIVVATLLVTCLFTLATMGGPGAPPFAVLHDRQTMKWIAWLVLTPGVIAAARRVPFGEGSPLGWLGRHLLIGAVFAGASYAVAAGLQALMTAVMTMPASRAGLPPVVPSLAAGLLIYGLIAVSYQAVAYQRAAREREALAVRLRADLAEARLAGLEGKLHPHFLFNALNSIAALVRIDPRQAETMLEQLSELLRAALRTGPTDEVALEEALRLVEQYLAIEQVRYQDRLRASIEASGEARRAKVPPLLLQPLVENAVRHGIAPREAGGAVRVTASVEEGTLVMTVEDDGVGIATKSSQAGGGLGLRSVRALLAHLYGSKQRFEVGPRSPCGTLVTIALPYRPAVA